MLHSKPAILGSSVPTSARETTTVGRTSSAAIGRILFQFKIAIFPIKCHRVLEKPIHPTLLDLLLPFFLCAFGLKLALELLLFEFSLPLNPPLIAI